MWNLLKGLFSSGITLASGGISPSMIIGGVALLSLVVSEGYLYLRGNHYQEQLAAETNLYNTTLQDNGKLQEVVLSDQAVLNDMKKQGSNLQDQLDKAKSENKNASVKQIQITKAFQTVVIPTECNAATKWAVDQIPMVSGSWNP